jgi:hypothetical protein
LGKQQCSKNTGTFVELLQPDRCIEDIRVELMRRIKANFFVGPNVVVPIASSRTGIVDNSATQAASVFGVPRVNEAASDEPANSE